MTKELLPTSGKSPLQPCFKARKFNLVRERGLEPPRVCTHQYLKLARLPFRHSRTNSTDTYYDLRSFSATTAPLGIAIVFMVLFT